MSYLLIYIDIRSVEEEEDEDEDEEEVVVVVMLVWWLVVLMFPMRLWDELSIDY